ncbi:MAG: DUF1697 domain-containing protein [Ginsengibacter sp.]
MQIFISILKGINVGGQKRILMADLKTLYESLQLKDVITYIQSGNVVFKSDGTFPDIEIAKKIEKAIDVKYGFQVPVIIRTKKELQKIISDNPFLKNKSIDVKKLHVTFLSGKPFKINVESIEETNFSPDEFVIQGKEIYLHIPESYGETKLSNNFFEKKLKVSATTRNWNTVNKLLEASG